MTDAAVRTQKSAGGHVASYLVLPLVLTLLAYRPIIGCYFAGDDFFHLQDLVNDPLPRFLLKPNAGHVYVVRNAVFALSHHFFGMQSEPYFVTVLLTHLANVALLFALVCRRTGSAAIACVIATLWGTSPLNESTLGWYSAYGPVLLGLLALLVLNDLARVDDGRAAVRPGRIVAWALLLLMGCTCYGIGIGIAAAFPLAAWSILRSRLGRGARAVLIALPTAVVALYAGLILLYAALYGAADVRRNLPLVGLLRDWWSIVATVVQLPMAGASGLLANSFLPHARYPEPALLAIGIACVVAYAAALVTAPDDVARWLRGLGLLVLGGYALIALGRGPLFVLATGFAAAAGEPRYHYVGSLLLAAILGLILGPIAARVRSIRVRTVVALVAVAVINVGWWRSGWVIDRHDKERDGAQRTVKAIEQTLAKAFPRQPVYIQNHPPAGVLRSLFVGTASMYAIYFPEARPFVFFVEADPAIRSSVPPGSRIARSLVPWAANPIKVPDLSRTLPADRTGAPAPRVTGTTTPVGD